MNAIRPVPHNLQSLPTLTEVIEMPPPGRATGADELAAAAPAEPRLPAVPTEVAPVRTPGISEEEVIQRVLHDLQRHTELMLEYRLREALTPALARLSDALIRDLRQELAATLRDVVARAVSQEMARRHDG